MALCPVLHELTVLHDDVVAAANQLVNVHILRAIVEREAETDIQHIAHVHPSSLVSIGPLEPQNCLAVGNGGRTLGVKDALDDTVLHAIGIPGKLALGRTQQHHLTRTGTVIGDRSVTAGKEDGLVGGDVLVGIAHAVYQIERERVFPTGYLADKCQAVDKGTVIVVQHEARAVVATQHQLVIANLTAQGESHLIGGRSHEEVAVDGTHHLMTGPRVARRHIDGRLTCHRLIAAQAGLHHDVGVG